MQFLISKFRAAKWLFVSITPLLALLLGFVFSVTLHKPIETKAQTFPQPSDIACIADGLIEYMNTVVESGKALNNIGLLSPAFNLTNPAEASIFSAMVSGQGGVSGNFNDLDGFAGNTYSGVPGSPDTTAYQWYEQNFKNLFFPSGNNSSKIMVFTEYGDYDYNRNGAAGRPGLIALSTTQHRLAGQDPKVAGINYFNAIEEGGNVEFNARHNLSSAEYNTITSPSPDKAGVNSASPVSANGAFVDRADNYSKNVNWVVEIAYQAGDLDRVVDFATKATQEGMVPVLRICSGLNCGFADPNTYVEFLKSLNGRLESTGGFIYVLTGPNEPATELWATPQCVRNTPLEIKEIACDDTATPEFHSLRPYPASATCPIKILTRNGMCGNDFVIEETITVNRGDANAGCILIDPSDPNAGLRCTYKINRTAQVAVDLSLAELPIMGNTQLVPNSANTSLYMPYGQRMTEYVSWYLNGSIQRAEEIFSSVNSVKGLGDLINFSGPLRKSLPFAIQSGFNQLTLLLGFIPFEYNVIPGLRMIQADLAGNLRHDQTVSCGSIDSPAACYSESQDYKKLTEVESNSANWPTGNGTVNPFSYKLDPTMAFNYIPFTSTEDLVEKASLYVGQSNFTVGDVNISNLTLSIDDSESGNLYFPHMQESLELAKITQDTFIPKDMVGKRDYIKTNDIEPPTKEQFCEFRETRSNPGDSLYGDVDRADGYNDEPPITGTTSYTATFECEFRPTVDQALYNQCYMRGYCTSQSACVGTWTPDPTCDALGDGNCQATEPPPAGQFDNPYCREISLTYPSCTKVVKIPLNMEVNTPNADPIWARLVAGPMSVFRRFYPKTGVATPVEKIKDIPGESAVGYSATSDASITATAGDGSSGGSGSLYFPHLGGIQEYFLNGIQKALLPYGGPGSTGSNPPPNGTGGNCTINAPYPIASGLYQDMLVNAARTYNIPVEALIAVLWGENCRSETIYNGQSANICSKSNDFLAEYLTPGKEYPHTAGCPGNYIAAGSGVYQFQSFYWDKYPISQPASSKICSIYDSTYAAAKFLSWTVTLHGNTPNGANWTEYDAKMALSGWSDPGNTDANGPCDPTYAATTFYCNWVDANWGSTTVSCRN